MMFLLFVVKNPLSWSIYFDHIILDSFIVFTPTVEKLVRFNGFAGVQKFWKVNSGWPSPIVWKNSRKIGLTRI